jgi:hypothetical protein
MTKKLRIWLISIFVALAVPLVGVIVVGVMVSGEEICLDRSPVVGTAGESDLELRWTLVQVDASRPVPAALARQEGDKTWRLDNRLRDRVRVDPHRVPLGHVPRHGGVQLLRPSPVVGAAGESDLRM